MYHPEELIRIYHSAEQGRTQIGRGDVRRHCRTVAGTMTWIEATIGHENDAPEIKEETHGTIVVDRQVAHGTFERAARC